MLEMKSKAPLDVSKPVTSNITCTNKQQYTKDAVF